MATSGTLSTKYTGYTYQISWSVVQSVGTSTITCVHKLICGSGYDLYIQSRTNSCTVDGTSKSFTSAAISTTGNKTITLGTTTHTVSHSTTKSVSINGVFNIQATLAGVYKSSISVTGTITLEAVATASQPSCITWPEHTQNVGYFGDTISIHMNRQSSSFTHTVRYKFGTKSGTIATGVTTGTTWTIPTSFMDLIPGATSGSGTIYADTYNGSTLIGTKSCGFTAYVPSASAPTCSISVSDATNAYSTYGSFVKGLSKLYIVVTATAKNGASIASYNVSANGVRYTSNVVTTSVLQVSGTATVTATATDSRGNTSSLATKTLSVLNYFSPKIVSVAVHRCDADGKEVEDGPYVKATFSGQVASMNNKNTAKYQVRYKKTGTTTWTTVTLTDLNNQYMVSGYDYLFAADENSSYDVEFIVTDRHSSTNSSTSASTGFVMLDFNAKGNGMGIGKVSETEDTLEVGLKTRFFFDVEFGANVTFAETFMQSIFDAIYPVGSIYLAYNHTDPSTLFGGTWVRIENRFLWATTPGGIIGQTGGENEVTLTRSHIPEHQHEIAWTDSDGDAGGSTLDHPLIRYGSSGIGYTGITTLPSGGGQAHNNMPPYIQVSVWRRTA